jgi:hypothetical protein
VGVKNASIEQKSFDSLDLASAKDSHNIVQSMVVSRFSFENHAVDVFSAHIMYLIGSSLKTLRLRGLLFAA